MKPLSTLLIAVCLCNSAYSKGKKLDCNNDDEDDPNFLVCCEYNQEDKNWQTKHLWGPKIDVDKACKCSQFLSLDNMINYWDIHYCQSRYVFSSS